jgi:phosphate transport system protein
MRDRFNEQLEQLHTQLIQMGTACEEAIAAAAKSLENPALAEQAVAAERDLDQREQEVETLCLRLLLQQQPVAGDLRMVSAALKMISDLERIGDQAADIAELAPYVRTPGGENGRVHINDMARQACHMVNNSVDAFVKRDLELARDVCAADDQMDALFEKVRSELIGLISFGPEQAKLGLDLLMVAKYFERIGDHATNVAEWVEFALTGIHPEHNDKQRK